MDQPISFFSSLPDPRRGNRTTYALTDILFLVLCAVLAGCESWNDISEFGRTKTAWLRRYIKLEKGVPSHDTLNRVFALLDPAALHKGFLEWVAGVCKHSHGDVVAIDGKSLCNAGTDGSKSFVHLVHAWSEANQMLIGQLKTTEASKTNEIKAIPALIEMLSIKGCILTIDAMGCQWQIAKAITEKEGYYVLAVKGNQSLLLRDIKAAFEQDKDKSLACEKLHFEHTEYGHGRIEYRSVQVLPAGDYVVEKEKWPDLKTLARIENRTTDKKSGEQRSQVRYYICSVEPDAALIARAVRAHWSVENQLHWSLDVVFGEDYSTKQAGNAAQNFSLITKMGMGLLKKETSLKRSMKGKRLKAAWDENYLQKIIGIL